ncbi:UNVERIFIED_CONTAM: DUF1929 domain-containing protein, partial [Salmonella enterica subsp. enterica serovar Weltevreden]
NLRPKILWVASQNKITYSQRLHIQFSVVGTLLGNSVGVTLVSPSFATHSFSMNQRLIWLGGQNVKNIKTYTYEVAVTAPTTSNLAPSGYY